MGIKEEETYDDKKLFELFMGTIVVFVANKFIKKYGDMVYGTKEELISLISGFIIVEIDPFLKSEFPRFEKKWKKLQIQYMKILQ